MSSCNLISIALDNQLIYIPTEYMEIMSENNLVGNILNNMLYYGYCPNIQAIEHLNKLDEQSIIKFWEEFEPALKAKTGSDIGYGKHVVYKNFPHEVLTMEEGEYWMRQVFIYLGAPYEFVAEKEAPRAPIFEQVHPKILQLAFSADIKKITQNLIAQKNAWIKKQEDQILFLYKMDRFEINIPSFGNKKNAVNLIRNILINLDDSFLPHIPTSTDILRLACALSDSDVGLTDVKFGSHLNKRKYKKLILSLLDKSHTLFEDISVHPELFKMLFRHTHPGDYQFNKVKFAYDLLYKNQVKSFNQTLYSKASDPDLFSMLLTTRPGVFVRKFHEAYALHGDRIIEPFLAILPKLTVSQLAWFEKYVNTINTRKWLLALPNSSWSQVKSIENKKTKIPASVIELINQTIHKILNANLKIFFPNGVYLDARTKNIKLSNNADSLLGFGVGTKFYIPGNIDFIRTASYWEHPTTIFMDNSWNFFSPDFKKSTSVCWNNPKTNFSVFSGDPVNSNNSNGMACQMIDLNPQEMKQNGYIYGVWSLLSFSNIPFSKTKTHACLQYGQDSMSGELFEPSRSQINFQVFGNGLSTSVAVFSALDNSIMYLSVPIKLSQHSAKNNEGKLSRLFPALLEYAELTPSIWDLFEHADNGNTKILYTDTEHSIQNEKAYVFDPKNQQNKFTPIDLKILLNYKKRTK